jgi:hypothetical protein
MGIVVGFHVEGNDHLILKCFVAKIAHLSEADIVADICPAPSRGWQAIVETIPAAIQRFYSRCAQFAVIGIDNDGNDDLSHTGKQEDANRPRHWNHATKHANCRFCKLYELVVKERSRLIPLPQKPPAAWPVLIAVPVETIEAWILELQAIVDPKKGIVLAEKRDRSKFKLTLYGMPAATQERIERIALPLIRNATIEQLNLLRQRSRSFDLFASQIEGAVLIIQGPRDCWTSGDGLAQV